MNVFNMAETTGYSDICLACQITTRKKTRRVLSKESNELILLLLNRLYSVELEQSGLVASRKLWAKSRSKYSCQNQWATRQKRLSCLKIA